MLQNTEQRQTMMPKHFNAKMWNVLQWPNQSPDLNPFGHAFYSMKAKQKAKTSQEQAGTEYRREETQCLMIVTCKVQTSASQMTISIVIVSLSKYF